ncbi:MAG: efflux RND transporter periplasmic adaptor subunit [Gammaproteobacteria bacterium]|nr:efflux RND transporter periplasmic adaptor subunit [Gammaproteobacteria bacterium]
MQRLVFSIHLFVLMSCLASFSQAETEIVMVEEQLIPKVYSAPGYTAALNKIEISSKQTGYITQLLVEAGDIVEKGQLLLVIDETANKQSIEQVKKEIEIAQVTVTDAKKDVNNFEQLRKVQSVSEEKLRKARLLLARSQSTLLQAKAKLIETKSAMPYLRIKSPEKALVVKRLADTGDLALSGSPLLHLEVLDSFVFETTIPAQWIKKITNEQSVNIKFNYIDFPNSMTTGTITQIIRSADPITQKCTVKLELDSSLNIPTGLFGQAQFIIDNELLLTIPEKALIKKVGITGVFRMDEEKQVWFTPVRYGRKYCNQRVILSGLKAQDKVIVSPSESLRDGLKLTHVKKNRMVLNKACK